jgi:hypothetical protein
MATKIPHLENWFLRDVGAGMIAFGDIYNDPRFPDGSFVRTSLIKKIDGKDETLETQNTVYTLGKEKMLND